MELIAVKCPNCGANIETSENRQFVLCPYCDSKLIQEKNTNDSSDYLSNLYTLAREARKGNDFVNAKRYYDIITIRDLNSWEANFYTAFCQTITEHANTDDFCNTIKTTFLLIRDYVYDTNEKVSAILDINKSVYELAKPDQFGNKYKVKFCSELYNVFKDDEIVMKKIGVPYFKKYLKKYGYSPYMHKKYLDLIKQYDSNFTI